MKSIKQYLLGVAIICCTAFVQNCNAQDTWASWDHVISVKGYEGRHFRLQAQVKAAVEDDSASARLWARVDKTNGKGFFENMWARPIRSTEWKTYRIEGDIDSAANQLVIGALCELNGKFYYDNFKVDIQKGKNKWETLYATDFENGMEGWESGIGMGKNGVNNLYKASLQTDGTSKGKFLLIEGQNVSNYGFNKKAGKFADVNGIKLYYEIYGEGAPLVVLHGNGGSISNAGGHYPDLIKKYKVIAIDSRSQGRSTDTDQPLNYDVMASDVNALLEKLQIDSVFIWGQSDGAILGLVLAMDYPKKVKRVLAYGANIQPDSSAVFPWAVTAVNRLIKTSKDKHEVKLYEMMRDYPNIPYSKLHSIKAPVLIMGGDRDVIRPEHLVKMFQNIPNSQLCILPGSTHGGAWEKKEMFLQILDDFFNKPFTMPTTEDWFKE
ncbi:MAG TPA: alpha/beta hydrolase [Chitinophagaceae bacterium]|nr:alpha/beta hydrolase [Chitinophagaceae bacterium]